MHLKKLNLINFKNYPAVDLKFDSGVNVITGNNGSGKTNVLDSIHYLSMCKSYFNAIDSQNILHQAGMCMIQGEFSYDHQVAKVHCALKQNHKKQFQLNEKDYQRLSDHIGLFPVVMVSPVDHVLITGFSEERRRFADTIISQVDKAYLENLILYNKVLAQRNAYLKQASKKGNLDATAIQVWDEQLVQTGGKIFERRKQFIMEFEALFLDSYNDLADHAETVSVYYDSHLHDSGFAALLKESLEKDRILQFTTTGIHKDDITFNIGNYPIKRFGSQGQQKTFLIALKLAQFEWISRNKKIKPILLLDDIFDKLDDNRIKKLMAMVSHEKFGQIFITDTHEDRVEEIFHAIHVHIKKFRVQEGTIIH